MIIMIFESRSKLLQLGYENFGLVANALTDRGHVGMGYSANTAATQLGGFGIWLVDCVEFKRVRGFDEI